MSGPLEGVRVLDLTTMVAGPVAAMMLADQGADVIKVESPAGDLMRRFAFGRNGMSASFLSCNRNKRSLAIDMKSAEGLHIVKKLVAAADVLMHNFRPGTAERVGVGEDSVRANSTGHHLCLDQRLRRERTIRKSAGLRSSNPGVERPG